MLTLTLAVAGVSVAAIQQTPAPPPTFRSETSYVEVDVRVTNKQGAFVSTLSKNDFQVFEDKHPRPISILQLVDLTKIGSRRYVMVLDDLLIPTSATVAVRRLARQFIQRNLDPADEVSIVKTSTGLRRNSLAPTDRAALLAAVDGYSARAAEARGSDNALTSDERAQYALMTLATIQGIVRSMPPRSTRRTSILLFSNGTDYDTADFRKFPRGSDIVEAMRDTVWLALRDNVAVYTIDPRGMPQVFTDDDIESMDIESSNDPLASRLQTSQLRVQGVLSALAAQTGGFAAVNRENFDTQFKDVVRDNSAYYLVGFCPETSEPDGKTHRIEVKVTGSGLTVKGRREYTAPARGRATARPTASAPCG
jgi:VWFA-related protein